MPKKEPSLPKPLPVLVIPDKFKGTLTALQAAQAIHMGWRRGRPGDLLDLLPMSDGGDGFGEVMGNLLGAKVQWTKTVDAKHRPVKSRWWWDPRTKSAIIESAEVVGLAKNPGCHPYDLDTFGVGALLRAAAQRGARKCLVGIGGTATVDGGFGLAKAMGWKFLDASGNSIESWTRLGDLVEIISPKRPVHLGELIVAVDVQNPLLGPRGCARVYGPQKGLTEFDVADRCLGRLAQISRQKFGRDFAKAPGAGAAGGLGFGMLAFLGAKLEPGFGVFAVSAKLNTRLKKADLVITGEGSIDRSTLMGKGVGQIAGLCQRLKIPCLGLAGVLDVKPGSRKLFRGVHALTDVTNREQAMKNPVYWLEDLASKVALNFDQPVRRKSA